MSITPFLVQFPTVGTIRKSLVRHPTLNDKQVATCWYGTRVDYIFHLPFANDEWIVNECFIVNTQQATEASIRRKKVSKNR
jgi:hypothetical protein